MSQAGAWVLQTSSALGYEYSSSGKIDRNFPVSRKSLKAVSFGLSSVPTPETLDAVKTLYKLKNGLKL